MSGTMSSIGICIISRIQNTFRQTWYNILHVLEECSQLVMTMEPGIYYIFYEFFSVLKLSQYIKIDGDFDTEAFIKPL